MKRLLCSTFIVGSLALTGNAAMASTTDVHKVVWPDVDYSRVTAYPAALDQHSFGFAFAGTARGGAPALSSSTSDDTSSPIDYSAQQASDAANQQMMLNSMQATQEANDEANAAVTAGILAAQQTEINANNYANNPNN
jgi:hypothetical protein